MNKIVSRALWGAFFVGGLTVLGAGAANAADTSGEDGIASGNQIGILSELPVTIDGNAISILGDSESSGTSTEATTDATSTADGGATSGEDGIASGNQVMPDATLPITIGGNSISIIGDSSTEGTSTGTMPTEGTTSGTAAETTGEDGIASGNQVAPDVEAPVTVTGNDVSVIRDDMLDDGLLDAGLVEDGLLNDGLIEGPLVQIGTLDGILSDPMAEGSIMPALFRTMLVAEPVIASPTDVGLLRGDIDLDAIAPFSAATAAGVDGTVGAEGTASADSTTVAATPLMALAATAPAMMLAATGAEALPLIGGILLVLGSGLGMVASQRIARVIG